MTKEVRSRTFKSGNSVALRLPKALGIPEGVEMRVREEQGRYVVEPVEPVEPPKKKYYDFSFLDGRTAGLKPLISKDRILEWRDLDWDGKLLKRD